MEFSVRAGAGRRTAASVLGFHGLDPIDLAVGLVDGAVEGRAAEELEVFGSEMATRMDGQAHLCDSPRLDSCCQFQTRRCLAEHQPRTGPAWGIS